MIKKAFITDCEGPVSLNDNAYELCREFIPDGDKFFKVVSSFDDYLVGINRENYNAGNTLKLIAPFLKVYGLDNEKIFEFSNENMSLINGAKETMEYARKNMASYMVSTSYGQYIKALSDEISFPYENTFYTYINIDNSVPIKENERNLLFSFKDEILKGDFDRQEKIFFKEIPRLDIGKISENVVTVGGLGKKIAVDGIMLRENLIPKGLMYVGDSITDVEPLRFVRESDGLAISFNGNEFALKESEVAVVSDDAVVTSVLLDLFGRYNKNYCLEFVKLYSRSPQMAFENLRINFSLMDKFREAFRDREIPIVQIIDDDNFDYLLEKSIEMRRNIRGKDVGELS
ncbi:MAG: energy-converting hydrogenase A, subunit R [Methanobrevibacter sp.]|nr:energy-converting hydrogenase A, subunit R [Candidatus Methanovirga aequatorialis]